MVGRAESAPASEVESVLCMGTPANFGAQTSLSSRPARPLQPAPAERRGSPPPGIVHRPLRQRANRKTSSGTLAEDIAPVPARLIPLEPGQAGAQVPACLAGRLVRERRFSRALQAIRKDRRMSDARTNGGRSRSSRVSTGTRRPAGRSRLAFAPDPAPVSGHPDRTAQAPETGRRLPRQRAAVCA